MIPVRPTEPPRSVRGVPMMGGGHPLEHLSLDTVDYMAARLGLAGDDDGTVMYDPRRERIFGECRRRLGADGLRDAVAEVIA